MKSIYDVIIIGGGPAGLAASIEAKKTGASDVLIIERDKELGGILPQCIHNGFGSIVFKKDYPGPYYAQKFISEALSIGVEVLYDTMVLDLTISKKIYATSSKHGYLELQAKAIVLAMGCRERTRSQIRIPGSRPAGVFTAGTVQRFVNIEGFMPGKKFVILGSGDIGMIMARRLTLEGAKVERVLEIMPYLTGLRRNYVQCLKDFKIELNLQHTIKKVVGNKRVEAIITSQVDESFNIIENTESVIECDTLLLSVGLIPENELSRKIGVDLDPITGGPIIDEKMETNIKGVFACGNVVNIHDLVDYVTEESYIAGRNAALFSLNKSLTTTRKLAIEVGSNIHSLVPHYLNIDSLTDDSFILQLRVNKPFDNKIIIEILDGENTILSFKEPYARPAEMIVLKVKTSELVKSISTECSKLTLRVKNA